MPASAVPVIGIVSEFTEVGADGPVTIGRTGGIESEVIVGTRASGDVEAGLAVAATRK